jgi:hypothetical protein
MNGLYKTILSHEAKIGGKIFENTADARREFYCLDGRTWVWREDSNTVIYKVNSTNIYKSNDGKSYRLVGKEEARRLARAAKTYKSLIERKVFGSLLALR